jgi:hypothetical protein
VSIEMRAPSPSDQIEGLERAIRVAKRAYAVLSR